MVNPGREGPPAAVLMNLITSKFVTHAVAAAAHFKIADQLKDGPQTAEVIAHAVGAHPPSMYRLMRALAMVGVLTEDEGHVFALTPVGAGLRTDVPASLAAVATFMGQPWHDALWSDLAHSVRTGESAARHQYGETGFEWMAKHPAEAAIFHEGMTSLSAIAGEAVVRAYDFSRFKVIADVGGGHGVLLSAILRSHPSLRGVLFDQPAVVEGARARMAEAGLSARCEIVGGDFFQTLPFGCDAYLLKHILHDWSDEGCVHILRRCAANMAKGGRVLVIEQILTPPGVPGFAKLLDLEMLVATEGGRERTDSELAALFAHAGLELTRCVPTESPVVIVEAAAARSQWVP